MTETKFISPRWSSREPELELVQHQFNLRLRIGAPDPLETWLAHTPAVHALPVSRRVPMSSPPGRLKPEHTADVDQWYCPHGVGRRVTFQGRGCSLQTWAS